MTGDPAGLTSVNQQSSDNKEDTENVDNVEREFKNPLYAERGHYCSDADVSPQCDTSDHYSTPDVLTHYPRVLDQNNTTPHIETEPCYSAITGQVKSSLQADPQAIIDDDGYSEPIINSNQPPLDHIVGSHTNTGSMPGSPPPV